MIKVKTKYNEETVKAFYKFQFYHNKQRKNITLVAIFCIVCGSINFFLYLNVKNALVVKKEEHSLEIATLLQKNVQKK